MEGQTYRAVAALIPAPSTSQHLRLVAADIQQAHDAGAWLYDTDARRLRQLADKLDAQQVAKSELGVSDAAYNVRVLRNWLEAGASTTGVGLDLTPELCNRFAKAIAQQSLETIDMLAKAGMTAAQWESIANTNAVQAQQLIREVRAQAEQLVDTDATVEVYFVFSSDEPGLSPVDASDLALLLAEDASDPEAETA